MDANRIYELTLNNLISKLSADEKKEIDKIEILIYSKANAGEFDLYCSTISQTAFVYFKACGFKVKENNIGAQGWGAYISWS